MFRKIITDTVKHFFFLSCVINWFIEQILFAVPSISHHTNDMPVIVAGQVVILQ